MQTWSVQDAKARFSELLELCLHEGPQLVTKRGEEAVVMIPVKEWRRLSESMQPSIKEWLLAAEPRFDLPIPARRKTRWRPPIDLG